MSKLKVHMVESWYTHRASHTIEINTADYEELKGMDEEEAFEYLSENMWEMELKKEEGDSFALTLADALQEDWVREKIKCEEFDLIREE